MAEERIALHDALELLHKASRTPPKQRAVQVSGVVHVICQHAYEDGLNEDALRDVVQLACVKTNLDQTSVTTLLKNLYPAQRVPSDVIITVVGALGQGKGKPSAGTQEHLVKWLMNVHDVLENPTVLSRLYGVLFGMLDMISIRTSLCHLLSLITRRKHVKPYRIQQLLELSRGLGNEPALQGLLRVFKDYYPDIILGSTSTSRKSFAPQPDTEWRTRISAIQEASIALDDATTDRHNGFKVRRQGPKNSKIAAIPDVHTYQANETSVTLEGVNNVEDFVDKLDRIEPPGQFISFLTDPLLQKYVDLKPTPITSARIDLWLATSLEHLYEGERSETGDVQHLGEMLEGLLKHARYSKTLHPTALAFLTAYVRIWNGHEHVDAMLGLLSYVPVDTFADAYATFFQPVEQTLGPLRPDAYEKLIDFYTSLLQRQIATARTEEDDDDNKPNADIFNDIAAHVSTLSMSLLLSLPSTTNTPLTSSILSFYEVLSSSSKPRMIPIILPPMHLVYLLVQNASLAAFSRICGVIGAYKIAFDQHPKPVKDYYPAHVTNSLNWCLRDIFNLLWVSRGLITTEGKAVGSYCNPALRSTLNDYLNTLDRDYAIGTAFNLSNNSLLASCSAASWLSLEAREIEKERYDKDSVRYHQGPVSQRSLDVLKRKGGVAVDWDGKDGYKVFTLRWLADRGLGGIQKLMFATVTELKAQS